MERRNAIKASALLLGYGLSATTTAALLNGCKAGVEVIWSPKYLNNEQAELVEQLTEIIIPSTDTPGAKEVGVAQYIDLLYGEYTEDNERELFDEFLQRLEANAQGLGKQSFTELNDKVQLERLQTLLEAKDKGMQLFHQWTVSGYCTSEEVCKNILIYDPIPGKQEGCIPLAEIGGIRYI